MPACFQLRDCLLVGEIVGQGKHVDARSEDIFCGFVAQLEDFLDHFPLGFLQRTLFGTDLNQSLEFFIGQMRAGANVPRRDQFNDCNADCFQGAPDSFEQRH